MAKATHYSFDTGLDKDFAFIDPDISGNAQVVYGGKAYTGAELDIHKSDYGILATIVTDIVPDKHTKRLTVLIPPVNFPGDVGGSYVTSQAIISTEYTSFGGPDPVSGQAISYEAKYLVGSASVSGPS
ncbi:MAG: hypothetical protein O7E57_12505 [Gammaproteobacteria bacterium]|nr:hypothetical protein [Gammaproteobacteria bacterium]